MKKCTAILLTSIALLLSISANAREPLDDEWLPERFPIRSRSWSRLACIT